MKEVLVTFEEEVVREGIVAKGTYLMDAAKRLGVEIDDGCRRGEEEHRCEMVIGDGADILSDPTSIELEALSESERKKGKRLACQARIDRPGELKIMSVQKPKETAKAAEEEKPEEEFKKEFEQMPLEKKIASLLELEAIALGETFSFVINSPYAAFGKAMDVLAEFGFKKDRADQEAKRPEEHGGKKESGKASKANGSKASASEEGNGSKEKKKAGAKSKDKDKS